jgi:hypothetical protein
MTTKIEIKGASGSSSTSPEEHNANLIPYARATKILKKVWDEMDTSPEERVKGWEVRFYEIFNPVYSEVECSIVEDLDVTLKSFIHSLLTSQKEDMIIKGYEQGVRKQIDWKYLEKEELLK